MPKSAIPKHVLDRDWKGTDNDNWLMRLKKKVQYLVAAGPNVPSGFWKWREMPLTVFAMRSQYGWFRLENTDGSKVGPRSTTIITLNQDLFVNGMIDPDDAYISRIQPWCRWGIVLQWPLFFNCWFIYRKRDVVSPPRYKSAFGIKKMATFGIGFKRDGDKVYWLTMNGGGNFE